MLSCFQSGVDLLFDEDIKIASADTIKSLSSKRREKSVSLPDEYDRESSKGNTVKARELGVALAHDVVENISRFAMENEEEDNSEMATQRGILMVFAATVALEKEMTSSVVLQTAKNGFNAELEKIALPLYKAVGDSGAFSFYYLAYRRGTEVDRRIGQTFAMLCAHDGDPVFHELGEAIYCWFLSKSVKKIKNSGIE